MRYPIRAIGLFAALAALAACDAGNPDARTVTIRGEVTYLQRIALPADAVARVTLVETAATGGEEQVIASRQLHPEGQVPVGFELTVARNAVRQAAHNYGLRAEIADGDGNIRWRTTEMEPVQPLELDAPVTLRVHPVGKSGATEDLQRVGYACDGLRFGVTAGPQAAVVDFPAGKQRLPRVKSASGAKYSDGETVLWSKARADALVTYQGTTYRDCIATSPLTGIGPHLEAHGNEPFWNVRILGERGKGGIQFAVGLEAPRVVRTPSATVEPVGTGSTTAYHATASGGAGITVRVSHTRCNDSMSGQPFPLTVTVEIGDRSLRGCGRRVGP